MRHAKFNRQFTLSLIAGVYDRIREISDKNNLSMAEVLRDIVDRGLSTMQSPDTDNNSNHSNGKRRS